MAASDNVHLTDEKQKCQVEVLEHIDTHGPAESDLHSGVQLFVANALLVLVISRQINVELVSEMPASCYLLTST